MLIAAADTSDNWKYVSIIIGSSEDIKAIYRILNCKDIHMRQLSIIEKNIIIKGLTIKGDVRVVCFYVNRFQIVKEIQTKLSKKKRKSKQFIEEHYNYILKEKIRKFYQQFLVSHSTALENIAFECDADIRKTFLHLGMKPKEAHITHELADIIAYCNYKDRTVDKVVEKDISEELKDELEKRCL